MLDEIFAVGDAGFKARCLERFQQLRALGHTVLIVSHDSRIVEGFTDRALLIEAGRIVMEGKPGDVANRYLSSLTPPQPLRLEAPTGT